MYIHSASATANPATLNLAKSFPFPMSSIANKATPQQSSLTRPSNRPSVGFGKVRGVAESLEKKTEQKKERGEKKEWETCAAKGRERLLPRSGKVGVVNGQISGKRKKEMK